MTIEEAKELFFEHKCSSDILAKENSNKYQEYKNSNISAEMEKSWREERLLEYYNNDILSINKNDNNTSGMNLWALFHQMYELHINILNKESLDIIINTFEKINEHLDHKGRIIVIETMLGNGSEGFKGSIFDKVLSFKGVDEAIKLNDELAEILDNDMDSYYDYEDDLEFRNRLCTLKCERYQVELLNNK